MNFKSYNLKFYMAAEEEKTEEEKQKFRCIVKSLKKSPTS